MEIRGSTPSCMRVVWNSPGVFFCTRRPKISSISEGRPSVVEHSTTRSKKARARAGRSRIRVRENSIWFIDASQVKPASKSLGPRGRGMRSMDRIPLPLGPRDFEAGFTWEASMNQIEFSRTLILDRPARARAFFDRVVECSTTLGRPSEIELIFGRRVQKNTPGLFHTTLMHEGVEPRISIHYKDSREKLYLKE